MTAAIGGEVIEAAPRPDLLAPGTVRRPAWISEQDWARMPWPAQWKAARRAAHALASVVEVAEVARGTYRGGPVAEKPCGTYAAYRRHLRRREAPCPACRDANGEQHRAQRVRRGLAVKATGRDPHIIDSFILGHVDWNALSVEERVEAARRLDAIGGISRAEIARRTRLNSANLRRAFAVPSESPALSTGRVDQIACAPADSRRAS